MSVTNATSRFSSRVDDYVRYRPGYPREVLALLTTECGLTPASVVADVASGTGIFTRLLLENGTKVFAVEPNREMRAAGEQLLQAYGRQFISVAGRAEATTLPAESVDMITAAQAAHWFDRNKARREFVRILKPGGWLVLLWNERKTDRTPFLRDYERLLVAYGTDYQEVRHERTTAEIADFFAPLPFQVRSLETSQECDYTALEGRLLSSSYTPLPGEANYEPMLRELRGMFEAHQINQRVVLEYDTRVFYGQLA
jgi:ubiquinone/menaquinone biosynthesis C-methylase UbiE